MSNLIEIQNQIEKLQKQATEIRTKEFSKTVQEIIAKMSAFGITLKDLQSRKPHPRKVGDKNLPKLESPKAGRTKAKNKRSTGGVPAKYKGPNGELWSGRGLTPRWLSVLIEQGKVREEFEIKK